MLAINNILLVLDQDLDNRNAIKRAMQVSKEQGANLFITTYIYNHACEEGSLTDLDLRHDLKALLIEQSLKWAGDLIQEYYLPDDTPLSVCWCNHAYQSVIDNSQDCSFDLVIKAAASHHGILDRVMQHQDWNLLKLCPAPVLLVKQKSAWDSRKIIAAIDATSLEDAHKTINEHIFEFAEILNADRLYDVHLVNSYPMMSLTLASLPDTPVPEDLQQYVSNQHINACEIIAKKYNIPDQQSHIREGEPEEVITTVAKELDADVVIIGMPPEEGIQGILLGSTVERVLDNTQCDIIAIKPQDGVIAIEND
ncbi:MAG: universal stress protein E [Bermanella sp.]|jgi:universal stress protein E